MRAFESPMGGPFSAWEKDLPRGANPVYTPAAFGPAVIAFWAALIPVSAQTMEIEAVADTYLHEARPNDNLGAEAVLVVQKLAPPQVTGTDRALVGFDQSDSVPHAAEQLGWVQFDVTADVRAFLAGTPSHGWLLKLADEPLTGRLEYKSRETSPEFRPRESLCHLL